MVSGFHLKCPVMVLLANTKINTDTVDINSFSSNTVFENYMSPLYLHYFTSHTPTSNPRVLGLWCKKYC